MTIFLAYFALQLAANCWLTYRIQRDLAPGVKRGMLVIVLWIIPVFGAVIANFELPRKIVEPWRNPEKLPAGFLHTRMLADLASLRIVFPGVADFSIQENLIVRNEMPVLNWDNFSSWLNNIQDPQQRRKAKHMGHRTWLYFMKEAIGPHCYLYESDEAIVLSTMEPNVIVASARFIAKTRAGITRMLGEIARFPTDTKSILLVFDNEEIYRRYTGLYHHAPQQMVRSSGMFLDLDACPHFVTMREDLLEVEPIITHELTHSAVQWLDLPLWLNEGLAMNVERGLHRNFIPALRGRELHVRLLQFWDEIRIQEFWSGQSFHRHDDGPLLSYELAYILVENLAREAQTFKQFALAAKSADAGASAARQIFGLDLGDAVCQLLEQQYAPGWSPVAGRI